MIDQFVGRGAGFVKTRQFIFMGAEIDAARHVDDVACIAEKEVKRFGFPGASVDIRERGWKPRLFSPLRAN